MKEIEDAARDERIRELEQRIADLGPWTVKDLRQYAEDTVADFRSLREQLKTTRERLAEAERSAEAARDYLLGKPNADGLKLVIGQLEEYFAKHEKP